MSDGDWQRRDQPYGDQSSPGGGGRRRAGGQPAPDPYAQDPYGRPAAPGYGQAPPPQGGYSQPEYAQPYEPQGYAPPAAPPAQSYAPPPADDPAAASRRGRRAAPRTGPKVVQSEVIAPSAAGYGYEQPDAYPPGHDSYGHDRYPNDQYGAAEQYPADDGWGSTAAPGYADQEGYAPYDDGRGADVAGGGRRAAGGRGRGRGRGRGGNDVDPADGWDEHGQGGGDGYGDDDYMDARPPRRSKLRAWAPLIVLVVVLGAFGGCMYGGYSYFKGKYGPAADFTNTNCVASDPKKDPIADQHKVPIEVADGDIGVKIGATLFKAGVVKSAKAYVDAANNNQSSSKIAAGTYDVCPGISGAQAVLELLKAGNIEKNTQIDVRSSRWSTEIIASVASKRHFTVQQFQDEIAKNSIGLPAWSKVDGKWSVEGMLEPGQYQMSSKDTPQTILAMMVKRRTDQLTAMNFAGVAGKLNCGSAACTPEQALTIASMAEAEVTDVSQGGAVSEAIQDRLKANDALRVDSTTIYGLQVRKAPSGTQVNDTANIYSTGARKGLPPGPIGIPSMDMIKAVLSPTSDHWYYWCAQNGATQFFTKNQQHAFEQCAKNAN